MIANRLRDAGIACMTVADFARQRLADDGAILGFAAFSEDVIEAMRPAIDEALGPLVPAAQRASGR